MKVLYLISGIGPPAGWGTEFIQNLVFSISRKGCQAYIINPIYTHTHKDWRVWAREQEKNYNVKIIPLEAPAWISKNFLFHLAVTPIFVTVSAVRLCLKEKFDVIHEFSSTPAILFRHFIFNKIFKIPTVFTLSVYNNTIFGKFFWFKLFNFAKYYLIPSKEIIYKLKQLGINEKKIKYSPPGIDLSKFKNKVNQRLARNILKLPLQKFIVSYFGSLTKEKGVEDLVKAALIVNRELKNKVLIPFFVVWKGSKKHLWYKKYIQNYRLPNIKIIEKLVDIPTVLAASSAIILPQQTGHGTTIPPISSIESVFSGRPTIMTNIIGNRDLAHYTNVTLVPPRNPEKLAGAIRSVFKPQDKYQIKKNNLRDYNLNSSINNHLRLYRLIAITK